MIVLLAEKGFLRQHKPALLVGIHSRRCVRRVIPSIILAITIADVVLSTEKMIPKRHVKDGSISRILAHWGTVWWTPVEILRMLAASRVVVW